MSQRERDKQLIKSLYNYLLRSNLQKSEKELTQTIVADILDPNKKAEVNPDFIPPKKTGVMNKAKMHPKKESKDEAKRTLSTLKQMPKPDLPKSEEQPEAKAVKIKNKEKAKGVKRLKQYMKRDKR